MVTREKATQPQLPYKRGSNPRLLDHADVYKRRSELLAEGQAGKPTGTGIMWKIYPAVGLTPRATKQILKRAMDVEGES